MCLFENSYLVGIVHFGAGDGGRSIELPHQSPIFSEKHTGLLFKNEKRNDECIFPLEFCLVIVFTSATVKDCSTS